ncbi:MAG: MBL fold metallo-hydrolase, partial [Yonghaparkia sp.]|nr:MBL fold metallo-hydrolase [Microcella sp.]
MTTSAASIAVTVVGGPTALLEWAGLRLLLDPTFDEPRRYGDEADALEKTAPPAVAAADLGRIDAVLASHHHHEDNLDLAGRELSLRLPLVVTTPEGARDLAARGGTARVIGLADHEEIALDDATVVGDAVAGQAPAGARLIALPAQHGPDEWAERLGPVCGFLLTAPGQPTVY